MAEVWYLISRQTSNVISGESPYEVTPANYASIDFLK